MTAQETHKWNHSDNHDNDLDQPNHPNHHHHHHREFGQTKDECVGHIYHVPYWRTESGHSMDDMELHEDDNLQANEIYQVHHKRGYWRWLGSFLFSSFLLLGATALRSQYLQSRNDRPASFSVRLNAGAMQPYTDSLGHDWLPDKAHGAYDDGSVVTIFGESILHNYPSNVTVENAGPVGEEIYRSERYFNGNSTMAGYEIAVPWDGWYEVTLHFAELWFDHAKQRVMDLYVEGNLVRRDYDILQSAGASFVATRVAYQTLVSDGAVSIEFKSKVEYAKISGIEVALMDDSESK